MGYAPTRRAPPHMTSLLRLRSATTALAPTGSRGPRRRLTIVHVATLPARLSVASAWNVSAALDAPHRSGL